MKEERRCKTDIFPAPAWGREYTVSRGEPAVALLQGCTPDLGGLGPQLPLAYWDRGNLHVLCPCLGMRHHLYSQVFRLPSATWKPHSWPGSYLLIHGDHCDSLYKL